MIKHKVIMFGPRRCGKSSVLASMVDQFETIKSKTGGNITLEPDESTKILMKTKKGKLESTFNKYRDIKGARWAIDEDPDVASHNYNFTISIEGAKDKIELTFVDIPGEWLTDDSQTPVIMELLNESTAVIVAVDTPHMMECNGEHNVFNWCDSIQTLLKRTEGKIEQPRLVLFVPVKCEKYYHENRMDEVNSAIKECYRTALSGFRKGMKKDTYMVAITPILTMGDVVFDDFQRKENGYVDCIENSTVAATYLRPKAAFYKLYGDNPTFSPKYCEQPLLYILNFMINISKISRITVQKKKKTVLQRIFELALLAYSLPLFAIYKITWKTVFSNKNVVEIVENVVEEVKTEGDGYEIIQNPFAEEN